MPAAPVAPHAPQEPFVRSFHGDDVPDPFHWMADKDDPRLRRYLEEENAYAETVTRDQEALREAIYADIDARTQQTDLSVPMFVTHLGGAAYWYYSRTIEGLDYPRHCRVPATNRDVIPDVASAPADEQVLLDVNLVAQGHDYCALGWSEMSPSGRLLAYSVDREGDERYDLYVIDVSTGEVLDGPVREVAAGGAWLTDEWLFYLRVDEAWRPHEVWRHKVAAAEDDVRVYTEPDAHFWMGLDSARDYSHLLIELGSKTTSETLLIGADDPTGTPRSVAGRRPGVEYTVEVARDRLFIVHNADHPQFALASAPLDADSPAAWTPLIDGRDDRRLNAVIAYDSHVVVTHRTDGQAGVAVLPRTAQGLGPWHELAFDEALYDVDAEADPSLASDRFRLVYESMVTPPSVLEFRLDTGERRTLKTTPVRDHPTFGPYDPAAYVQERVWARAEDGTAVPLSVVRRADTPLDGSAPALLYGYGAYEISLTPYFGIARLSLLDRGFVFAIAHVRGGGELGRPWYEAGKELNKRTSFTDFIACAHALIEAGYTSADRLVAEGGSAGGLLMGAVANLAPELFRGIHAAVPFVDALTTVLNPELPLTVTEWDEWGDPLHDPTVYAYMKSYSPYDNVKQQRYPALLVTTSFNDTRVEVTEPAKWVAKLRTCAQTDEASPIVLKTELVAGHGGVSGRYAAWRDRAFELAWMITLIEGRAAHPTTV